MSIPCVTNSDLPGTCCLHIKHVAGKGVLGLLTSSLAMKVNSERNRCLINPKSDTLVEEGDQLIMMRPTSIASNAYRPLRKPVKVDKGKHAAPTSSVCVAILFHTSPVPSLQPMLQF